MAELQEIVDKVSEKILGSIEEIVRSLLEEGAQANKEAIVTEISQSFDEKFQDVHARLAALEEPKKEEPKKEKEELKKEEPKEEPKVEEVMKSVLKECFDEFAKSFVSSGGRKSTQTAPDGDGTKPQKEVKRFDDLSAEEQEGVMKAYFMRYFRPARPPIPTALIGQEERDSEDDD